MKDELPRLIGAQYAAGEEWRNNIRKNKETEPKQNTHTHARTHTHTHARTHTHTHTPSCGYDWWCSKLRCCKQYCIGTWNHRSMNQGKLEVLKQEMARVNINILGVSKLKWTGMCEFNSDNHYIYYRGQDSLSRNGVAIIVNKRV